MSDVVRETVPRALAGQRLDRVVAMVADVSRREAAELVEAGAVTVDEHTTVTVATRVDEGQTVTVDRDRRSRHEPLGPDASVAFAVVYADDDVVVVDKPPGLVVHPGGGVRSATLAHGLVYRFAEIAGVGEPDRPGIVHRLDKGTSGLMVVARSPRAYDALVHALASRHVNRRYRAIVWDVPEQRRGVIDAPIGRSSRHRTKMAIASGGRDARTHYEVLAAYQRPAPAALVDCTLETGRTHQIRVHLASIGHAVVGDGDYGGVRRAVRASRPMLHAIELAFAHPVSQLAMRFESPIPDDFAAVLAQFTE